jgi:hypothetical protein
MTMEKNNIEPCLSKCKFIRHKDNKFYCSLYDMTELNTTTIQDPYDEGYISITLKCQDCAEKELSTLIDNKQQEIRDMYNVFVYEMDMLFNEMDKLQKRRRKIYE